MSIVMMDDERVETLSTPATDPAWRGPAGVYTVAYGGPARHCADRLLESWAVHMPNVPVAIATESPFVFPGAVNIYPDRPDIGAREPKLRMYNLTPSEWEFVLYLDADCELIQPVGFIFDALASGWDMVLTKNPGKYHVMSAAARKNNLPEVERTWERMGGDEFLQWNGGVVGFRRSPAVERFFTRWLNEWRTAGIIDPTPEQLEREGRMQDQPALHRAMFAEPLRVLTLSNEWNKSTRYPDGEAREIIRHYQTEAREMQGKLPPGVPSDSQWAWDALRKETHA